MGTALMALVAVGVARGTNLVVAHVGPYSGASATAGADYGAGARLYFDYINGHGGVHGGRIVLAARDDGGDPELTQRHAVALIPDKPIAFIGTAGVRSVNTLAPILETVQIPLVGPLVDVAGVDATKSRAVFHIQASPRQEVTAIVGRLRSLGFRKIALCEQGDRPTANVDGEETEGSDGVATIPLILPHCGDDSPSAETAVNAVVASRAQAVVFVGQTQPAANFIRALRSRGSFAMVVTSSSVDASTLAATLPSGAKMWLAVAESFPDPSARVRPQTDSIVHEFLAMRTTAQSPTPLTRASLTGFVAAKILVEAIRRAGANATSADVLKALRGSQAYDVGGMAFDFSRTEHTRLAYTRLDFIGRGPQSD